MLHLRPFQRDGVRRIRTQKGIALLADSMGLGKGVQSWAYARGLDPDNGPIIIVCQAHLKLNWLYEGRRLVGINSRVLDGRKPKLYHRSYFTRARALIVNYDILDAWADTLIKLRPQLIIIDECFPHDTPIFTSAGWLPIGQIVEKRLPVKIASRNSNGHVTFHLPSQYVKIPRRERLVQIRHRYGQLVCTENHLIHTENRGYVKAKHLAQTDHLCLLFNAIPGPSHTRTKNQKVLQLHMRRQMESSATELSQSVRRQISPQMQNQSSSVLGEQQIKQATSPNKAPHDHGQPIQTHRSRCQDASDQTSKRNTAYMERETRGQRTTHNTTIDTSSFVGVVVDSRTGNSIRRQNTRLPNLLQSGPGTQTQQNGSGDRRERTQGTQTQSEGRQETIQTRISRVESVTFLQSTDRQNTEQNSEHNSHVYCLTIKPHNNFFADGILVHNCQQVKNPRAKRTKACKRLCRRIKRRLALSGTPMLSRPIELFTVLNMLWPDIFDSQFNFAMEFCAPKYQFGHWNFQGASNIPRLSKLLRRVGMIRRTKAEVLKQLPAITRQVLTLELPPKLMKAYETEQHTIKRWWNDELDADPKQRMLEARNRLVRLKILIGKLKLPLITKWLEDWMENTDEKLLVFGIHYSMLVPLHKKFSDISVIINGKVKGRERHRRFDLFNDQKRCRFLFGNLHAAGTGWNCTATSNVANIELDWVPGNHSQAEARLHGMYRGVKGMPVQSYYLVTKGTIEERLCEMNETKQQVCDGVLDGRRQRGSMDIYSKLIHSITKEK